MNNNDYTVVPLKKAVVNKYINFAKKQYDEDNIKKQKFIKNFKWKLLAVLLSIFPMSCLSAAVIMMLIWSNDLASLIALSVLAITIVSVGIYLISNELLSLLKRKKEIIADNNSFSDYYEKEAWISDEVSIDEYVNIHRIIQLSLMTDSRVKNRNFEQLIFEKMVGNQAVFRLYYSSEDQHKHNNYLYVLESEVRDDVEKVEIDLNRNSIRIPCKNDSCLKGINITKKDIFQTA
jgi:hypothetical protein